MGMTDNPDAKEPRPINKGFPTLHGKQVKAVTCRHTLQSTKFSWKTAHTL